MLSVKYSRTPPGTTKLYDTAEEANQKLQNSTVLFKGLPVHVREASGNKGKVSLAFSWLPWPKSGPDKPPDEAKMSDEGWDFKTLGSKIGYVNIKSNPWNKTEEAVFVTRMPTRSSRQGFDDRTAKVFQYHTSDPSPWTFSHLLYDSGLVDSVCGKFPSTEEAVGRLIKNPDKVKSIAIGRKLMLIFDRVNPPNLVYRGEKVGYVESDGRSFRLAPHKMFLTEELADMAGLKLA